MSYSKGGVVESYAVIALERDLPDGPATEAQSANPQLVGKVMSTSLAALGSKGGFAGRHALTEPLSAGVDVTSMRDAIVRLGAKLCR